MVVLDFPPAPPGQDSARNYVLYSTSIGTLVSRQVIHPEIRFQLFLVDDRLVQIAEWNQFCRQVRVKKDGTPCLVFRGDQLQPGGSKLHYAAPITRTGIHRPELIEGEPPPEFWPSNHLYLYGQGGRDLGAPFFRLVRNLADNEVGVVTRSDLSASCVVLALPCRRVIRVREAWDGLTATALTVTEPNGPKQIVVFDLG